MAPVSNGWLRTCTRDFKWGPNEPYLREWIGSLCRPSLRKEDLHHDGVYYEQRQSARKPWASQILVQPVETQAMALSGVTNKQHSSLLRFASQSDCVENPGR